MIRALIPAGLFAAIGAMFLKTSGQAQASAGSVVDFDEAPAQFPVQTPSASQALPTDRALTFEQVYRLAKQVVAAYGFAVSPEELTVTAQIESSFRPYVSRQERRKDGTVWDTSYGLMQTLLGTAKFVYDKGYRAAGVPTPALLKKPEASMYFGAAYKDWLRRNYSGRSEEWYIRAYNGGQGWETTPAGPTNTLAYLSTYLRNRKRLFNV